MPCMSCGLSRTVPAPEECLHKANHNKRVILDLIMDEEPTGPTISEIYHILEVEGLKTDKGATVKMIHGTRPSNLTDEDYQAILDAEEGIFYLSLPEMSEVEKLQAAARITKEPRWAKEQFRRLY